MINNIVRYANLFYSLLKNGTEDKSNLDINSALLHVNEMVNNDYKVDDFIITKDVISIKNLYYYDDISSWAEWDNGELLEMSSKERHNALTSFRGSFWADMAEHWTLKTIQPIIIVETPELTVIGDGRGRVSYAIGMGWEFLPVIFMVYNDK